MCNKKRVQRLLIVFTAVFLLLSFSIGAAQSGDGAPPAPPDGTPPSGNLPPGGGGIGGDGTNPVLTTGCGDFLVDGEAAGILEAQTYNTVIGDVSAVCVINGGTLTLVNPTIIKTGDTSSSDQSSFYGLNAAVLVGNDSSVTIIGGSVTTDGAGTNGVFATGENATVTLSDMTINAVGDGAHAVMATLGGTMILNNVVMNTTDVHSGAVATDRGSGTITVTGGIITTSGPDSPGIYSTGVITVFDATIVATGAESAVIEGANSITLTNTSLTSSIEDKWGVMIYQSFSGDAEGSEGVFTMTNGSLAHTAENGPLFFVTNVTGYIKLTNVEVTAESGVLVNASGMERWGNEGENGGTVILTADNQTLEGDMTADDISTLTITLQNGSLLTGAINTEQTAKAANLTLDETSIWNVMADSYLTCLTLSSDIVDGTVTNIIGNGHTVYYDASACSMLNGATYEFSDGGYLKPLG